MNPIDPEVSLVIVIGIGDGSVARAVLMHSTVRHVLIYEPTPTTFAARTDFKSILDDQRVFIVIGEQPNSLKDQIVSFFNQRPFALTGVFNCMQFEAKPQTVAQDASTFQKNFHEVIAEKLVRLQPNEEDAFWGLINTVRNFPDLWAAPQLNAFSGLAKGRPGVLVGTGPSLEKSLSLLKEKRDRVVVCACDSALKVLLQSGITPDVVVSIERLGQTEFLFEGMPESPQVPLVTPAVMSPRAIHAYRGPKLRVNLSQGFDDWLQPEAAVEFMVGMPSVSHLGYLVLRKLGCDPVFLLGQDLSHDPFSSRSHIAAAATYIHEAEQDLITTGDPGSQVFEIPGNDGKAKRTNHYWKHFADAFGVMISQYGGHVFNVLPRQYGIPIPAATQTDPEEAFAALDPVPSGGPLNFLDAAFRFDGEAVPEHLQKIVKILENGSRFCLKNMRELGIFWMEHNPLIRHRGFEEQYGAFFIELEKRLQDFEASDDGFWEKYFRRLILNSYLGLRVERAQLLCGSEPVSIRLNSLIQVYYKTFHLIQLWAMRSSELISEHLSAWKF